MITSMNPSELYKTLVGHYKPNYYSTESNKKSVETSKVMTSVPEKAVNVKDLPTYKDISSELNRDRFEFSEKISYQTYDIGTFPVIDELKTMPYEASDAIDFGCTDIRTELESGYTNGLVTKERIAEFYGAMAKRLDEAYKDGKFTKDEYGELNEMIEKRVEKDAGAYERLKAFYALGEKRGRLSPEAVAEIVQREKSLTPEERLAAREQAIMDYAEKHFKIDRESLMQLFNSIRYGK